MKPNFEVYQRYSSQAATDLGPWISISKAGDLGLSQSAFELLGRPNRVELMFAQSTRMIGLRACDDADRNGYAITRPGYKKTAVRVGARAFCRHYGIDISQSRRYAAELMEDILAIDLRSNPAPATKGRPRCVQFEHGGEESAA